MKKINLDDYIEIPPAKKVKIKSKKKLTDSFDDSTLKPKKRRAKTDLK